MPDCPHCQQPIDARAVACPHCRATLKAFGHPGIPLHQASGDGYLCDRCQYHADDSCTFPQRPQAKTCTLFRDLDKPLQLERASVAPRRQRLPVLALTLVAIVAIAVLLALL